MASLATALELTRYPGWQEHYQLTIYQLGWRLGGKCATGRGVHGRIEEHGIHIMQGWYHNTFRIMEEVYEERLRHGLAPRARYPRFADALEPDNGTLMPEYCRQHHRWETYPLNFPPNEEVPGQGGPLSPWQNLHKLMSLGVELAAGLVYDRSRDPVRTAIHEHVAPRERVERILSRLRRALGSTRDDAGSFRSLARMLSAVSRALAVLAERQDECAVVRKLLTRVNLFRAMLDGLLRDVYVPRTGAFNFEAINHLDYRAWLALHGASREALDTSIVRFSYTGMFANLADGAGGGGLVSATSMSLVCEIRSSVTPFGTCSALARLMARCSRSMRKKANTLTDTFRAGSPISVRQPSPSSPSTPTSRSSSAASQTWMPLD